MRSRSSFAFSPIFRAFSFSFACCHWIAQVRSSAEAQAGLAAFLNRHPMPWVAPEA